MIGVFDSGVAGLAVVRALRDAFPSQDILFFADTARHPYGERSLEVVARFADDGMRHLIARHADLVGISCSAAAAAFIQGRIGLYAVPVIEGISAAADAAAGTSQKHLFGILGNRAAMASGVYERLIQDRVPKARIATRPSTLLDALIEEGWMKKPETTRIAKKLLHPLKVRQVDTLILDSFALSAIEKMIALKAGRNVRIIRTWQALSEAMITALSHLPQAAQSTGKTGSLTIQVTDATPALQEKIGRFLKSQARVEPISLF